MLSELQTEVVAKRLAEHLHCITQAFAILPQAVLLLVTPPRSNVLYVPCKG